MHRVRVREQFLEHLEQALPTVWERLGRDSTREPRGFVGWDYSEHSSFWASMPSKLSSGGWIVQLAICHFASAPVAKSDGPSGGN